MFLFFLIICALLVNLNGSYGQASEVNPANNPFDPVTDFLGWNSGVNSDLEVWHNTSAQPIVFGPRMFDSRKLF